MQDEETGSWWQQVSGEAIFGPLKGRQLKYVPQDELSFLLWKKEQPQGRVLRPAPIVPQQEYTADWEIHTAKLPVVTKTNSKELLAARTIIFGIEINGRAKAYTLASIQHQSPIVDDIAGVPIIIMLGEDKQSVRAFQRTIKGNSIELFTATPDSSKGRLFDGDTGSEWSFAGIAINGSRKGEQLPPLPILKDYWFDWQLYHPHTSLYHSNGDNLGQE